MKKSTRLSILSFCVLALGCASALFFFPKKKEVILYDCRVERAFCVQKYKDLYQELSWLTEEESNSSALFLMLDFLSAVSSENYLDYLALYMREEEHSRFGFKEFDELCKSMQKVQEASVFSKEELLDTLCYGLVLSEVYKTSEFKKRAWIYETTSLGDVVTMYTHILPSMDRFSLEQTKFLTVVLEGLQFEGYLDMYRKNIAYDLNDSFPILKENVECFDLSFLVFICRMAAKYSKNEGVEHRFSSGFYSYLMHFKKDLFTHLAHAS